MSMIYMPNSRLLNKKEYVLELSNTFKALYGQKSQTFRTSFQQQLNLENLISEYITTQK